MVYRRLKGLKEYVDMIFSPLARALGFFGVRPTHLTVLSLPFGLFGAWFVFEGGLLAPLAILAYFTLDFMDGTLARVTNTHTEFGGRLDFAVDRLVAVIFLVSYFFHKGALLLPVVGLLGIILVSLEDFGFKIGRT
jgi:phosphatidylglycerophosphate synthase